MAKGHAVAVLVVSPEGIPLIRDPKKPSPIYWKLPGGRGDASETAEECAIREIQQEIGVLLLAEALEVIFAEDRGNHILTIFRADLPTLPQLNVYGDEGEQIGIFSPTDIISLQDFFPNHRKVVEEVLRTL